MTSGTLTTCRSLYRNPNLTRPHGERRNYPRSRPKDRQLVIDRGIITGKGGYRFVAVPKQKTRSARALKSPPEQHTRYAATLFRRGRASCLVLFVCADIPRAIIFVAEFSKHSAIKVKRARRGYDKRTAPVYVRKITNVALRSRCPGDGTEIRT